MKNKVVLSALFLCIWLIKVDASMLVTFNTTPGSTSTNVMGFSRNQVVGFDKISPDTGFVYDPLRIPVSPAIAPIQRPLGIDGDVVVGTSNNNANAYYYNISDEILRDILIVNAQPRDVSGNLVVGSSSSSSFIYDITKDQIAGGFFKHPSGSTTRAWGIDGNVIVGEVGSVGFIYTFNIIDNVLSGTWQTLDGSDFGLSGVTRVNIQGVSGNYISGFYDNANGSNGFFYDYVNGVNFTTIIAPEPSTFMQARAIEGDLVAGSYKVNDISSPRNGYDVGFLYQIPEPTASILPTLSLLYCLNLRNRR